MPVDYPNVEQIHQDNFVSDSQWHHEGAGHLQIRPNGTMHLDCQGSQQGGAGCMAFFRPTLPDTIAVEYDIVITGHGGLIINYIGLRGVNGEDVIDDVGRLPPRTGIMANYWSDHWRLQSYHVSFSRYGDDGVHTGTSNWRRNPGLLLVGHGDDPIKSLGRSFHVRMVKDRGHCQFFVDGTYGHGFVDRNQARTVPDYGKFGFRLIGSGVSAEIANLRVYKVSDSQMEWGYLEYDRSESRLIPTTRTS